MKEAKNFGDKVQQLAKQLKRKQQKCENPVYEEPIDSLVYAVLSEQATCQQAQTAFKKIKEHFIDLNDLRVSRPEEVIEAAGSEASITAQTAFNLLSILKAIFEKYNMVSLADLKRLGKKQIRDTIAKYPGISEFVIDYCMLTAFDAHAIPLTSKMFEFLKTQKLVGPEQTAETISQMLARHVPAKDGYSFYAALRRESEQQAAKKQAKKNAAADAKEADKENKKKKAVEEKTSKEKNK